MKRNDRKAAPNAGRLRKKEARAFLIDIFDGQPDGQFSLKDLFAMLRAKTHPAKMVIIDTLDEMLEAEFLWQPARGVFALNPRYDTDDADDDEASSLIGHRFVGRLEVERRYAFLVATDRTLRQDIFIPKAALHGALNGQKAIVEITEWPARSRNPVGRVVEVLGNTGDNNVEMHAILAEYGLPYDYPEAVSQAAEKLNPEPTAADLEGREDFRSALTFTIDPRDAKDFDDALSLRPAGDGLWEVGVHIADVSHYIQEGDIIDREAQRRATSVYLVDRTIPMLPERLCNGVCSLRPDEDKLCFSAIFLLDGEARVRSGRLAHTVIRSDRRFTYEEVQPVLRPDSGTAEVEERFAGPLRTLWGLASQLRDRRFKSGSIGFERPEVRFDIDEKGTPVGTYIVESNESHWLIEEFMLLANRSVAESVAFGTPGRFTPAKGRRSAKAAPKVLPYRIHDLPAPEKLMQLHDFTARFGYRLRTEGSKTDVSRSINKLLADAKGKREEALVEMVALRCMQKARYSIHNIGHYGLMFDHYTHFTSPIRRYPDLMVHRLLTRYMDGARSASATKYEGLCEHSSNMEQLATQAERASIKYKQVEFMGARIGQEYDGRITGVTEFGFYVECDETHCEGMVALRDIEGDYYDFDAKNLCLTGRRQHHKLALGDRVRIRVARANLEKRQLDYLFLKKYGEK
ncbi:MAG: ribonuclease R [Bacteroidaceae bacterium]|nr:ribonuclease R [Bacteroidaceae bacterium]